MYKSKLVEMLRHFSPKELNRFSEYLSSPFFNKDEQVLIFYNHIKKFAPEFNSPGIDKDKVIERGIPGIVLTEKKLGYLMSDVVEHIEDFIRYNKFSEQAVEGYCHLLAIYNKWESDKLFDQTLREAKDVLDRFPYRDAPYFYKEYLLQSEINLYFDRQKKRAYDASLQKAADYLDLFYLANKLKYSCELINRQKLVAANYELRLLKEITQHLQEHSYDEFPSIAIYYQILMTFLENDNVEHFEKLKRLLDEHTSKFPPLEAKDMYAYAQNYTIRKINAGNQDFLDEYLHLSKAALEKNLLLVDGFLSPWAYKNIVSVALRVDDFTWTEQFIKNYRSKLSEKFRTNAYNYNLAYLLFFKGDYGEALKLINQVEFTDIFYALDSRTMQIKIYYQLEEWDPLQSAIEAFKVYMRRRNSAS